MKYQKYINIIKIKQNKINIKIVWNKGLKNIKNGNKTGIWKKYLKK